MPWTLVADLGAACAYAGFQATVRLVVYPQFSAVGRADFAAYERTHQRRITPLVGVLFALGAGAAILLFALPLGLSRLSGLVSGLFVAAILLVTGLAAVPRHRILSRGYDEPAFRALLRVDSVRLTVALLHVVWLLLWLG